MVGVCKNFMSSNEAGAGTVEFFPPRFWGLDPLFSAKLKLNIRDVLNLSPYPEFPGIYCIGNHPVLGVHVMGDVVSVREMSALIIYDVDDGSGVVSCVQWRKTRESSEGIYQPGIGQLVSVLATVDQFRDQRQLKVTAVIPEEDPNAEPCHWLEVEHLWRTVYSTSFTLPPGVTETEDRRQVAAKPVKELVEEVLLSHLSSRNSPFTLSTLTGSDEVMGAVWEGVRSETGEGGRGEVERELRAVVKSLPDRGLVVPAADSATFELLCEKKHLFPVILDFIKHKLHHPRAATQGVPQEWIVEHVRGTQRLQHVPAAIVRAAIDHLEEASHIFSVSEGAYKTVT